MEIQEPDSLHVDILRGLNKLSESLSVSEVEDLFQQASGTSPDK